MMAMKKVLESNMKIRFHDCDPYNHLNNARYIDYIMAARTDQLETDYGFNTTQLLQEHSLGWVSAQTQISYLLPAYVAEVVMIQTRLLYFSDKSLLVEGIMLNNDCTVIKAVLWAKLVHFNLKTQKSQVHADALMQLFSQVVDTQPRATGFEERVKILKEQYLNPLPVSV